MTIEELLDQAAPGGITIWINENSAQANVKWREDSGWSCCTAKTASAALREVLELKASITRAKKPPVDDIDDLI